MITKEIWSRPRINKPQAVLGLFPEEMDRRLEFAESILDMAKGKTDLFSKIVWSDEASFYICGFINIHISHDWTEQSP